MKATYFPLNKNKLEHISQTHIIGAFCQKVQKFDEA